MTRADIARVFPEVVYHTERPVLRTAPAPLFLLSRLVRDSGIKVVLTGEGADEMFAGYDVFREAKVRRFWARSPQSEAPATAPREALSVSCTFARVAARAHASVLRTGSGARRPRRLRTRAALARRRGFEAAVLRRCAPARRGDESGRRTARRPAGRVRVVESAGAGSVPRGPHTPVELSALVAGRSDADGELGRRTLSVSRPAGRRPGGIASRRVQAARARTRSMCSSARPTGWFSNRFSERKKQPYRAPDALSFASDEAREWIEDVASPRALSVAGIFNPAAAGGVLAKCRARAAAAGQFSNADNMAAVAVLSTQLVYHHFITPISRSRRSRRIRTVVDRLTAPVAALE